MSSYSRFHHPILNSYSRF